MRISASFSATRLDFVGAESAIPGEAGQVDVTWSTFQQRSQRAIRIIDCVGMELCHTFGRPALTRGSAQIEKPAAADRALCRGIAHHEAVARRGSDRPLKDQLDTGQVARRNRIVSQEDDACADFRCRMVQSRPASIA